MFWIEFQRETLELNRYSVLGTRYSVLMRCIHV